MMSVPQPFLPDPFPNPWKQRTMNVGKLVTYLVYIYLVYIFQAKNQYQTKLAKLKVNFNPVHLSICQVDLPDIVCI